MGCGGSKTEEDKKRQKNQFIQKSGTGTGTIKELDDAEEYLAQFDGAQPGQIIGEVSSVYLQRGQAIVEKIKYNKKLLITLKTNYSKLIPLYY